MKRNCNKADNSNSINGSEGICLVLINIKQQTEIKNIEQKC